MQMFLREFDGTGVCERSSQGKRINREGINRVLLQHAFRRAKAPTLRLDDPWVTPSDDCNTRTEILTCRLLWNFEGAVDPSTLN